MSLVPSPAKSGLIVLFGSGETSPTGRKIFEPIFRDLPKSPKLALLETPAGFELNSSQVIGRVVKFFEHRFQNHSPLVQVISARKRGGEFSPDNPVIVEPILQADMIFLGPGSPSYAVRQLRDSLAWHYISARHRLGCVLALASAATIAFSSMTLPVYEIYKAGDDLHWIEGLDFFKMYGLKVAFIPHWNNNDGGAELDTSRCFMGRERFAMLMEMLPTELTIIGLDEKTALIMDPEKCLCRVRGLGKITIIHTGHSHPQRDLSNNFVGTNEIPITDKNFTVMAERHNCHVHEYQDGDVFSMNEIGPLHDYHQPVELPMSIWEKALIEKNRMIDNQTISPPEEVIYLLKARQQARLAKDWKFADELRRKIENLGWFVQDTLDGPVSKKL